jgi:hypothetical protein
MHRLVFVKQFTAGDEQHMLVRTLACLLHDAAQQHLSLSSVHLAGSTKIHCLV